MSKECQLAEVVILGSEMSRYFLPKHIQLLVANKRFFRSFVFHDLFT